MRVVVPHTNLRPETRDALTATGHSWTPVDVSGSDTRYWRLICDLWEAGEEFIVVEHDIVVRPDTLSELEACPSEWCAFGAPYFVGTHVGMGCVKFSASLIARAPMAAWNAGQRSTDANHPPGHYCTLDHWLQWVELPKWAIRHVHEPPLGHIRDTPGLPQPSHGCVGGAT